MRALKLITFIVFTFIICACQMKSADAATPGSANQIIAKMEEVKKMNWDAFQSIHQGAMSLDTVYVGIKAHDTLRITGNYSHTGPIFVFNDGVLIIKNANVTNYGDVFVFGHGMLIADSSSLTFPQDYFYQRSLLVVQHG